MIPTTIGCTDNRTPVPTVSQVDQSTRTESVMRLCLLNVYSGGSSRRHSVDRTARAYGGVRRSFGVGLVYPITIRVGRRGLAAAASEQPPDTAR